MPDVVAPRRELRSVQALRALAALLVVATHLGGRGGFQTKVFGTNVMFARFGLAGSTGVDLFFAISGFIMVVTTARVPHDRGSALAFLERRITRVYPPYLVITAVLAAVYAVSPNLIDASQLVKPNVLDSLLLLPQRGLPLLLVGWTLTYEMYFYLVFTLVLLTPRRFAAWVLVAWAGLTVGFALAHLSGAYPALLGSPLNFEFLIGAGIGWLYTRQRQPFSLIVLGIGGAAIAASFVAVLSGQSQLVDDGWYRLLCFGAPWALCVYGVTGIEHVRPVRIAAVIVLLGDASYSLYLTHVLCLKAIQLGLQRFSGLGGVAENVIVVAAVYVVVVLVALAYYYVVERSLLRFFHDRRAFSRMGHVSSRAGSAPAT